MPVDIDVVIAGAGVVGLAIAQKLARQGRAVLVLEANARFGEETSARNSEVIHAGLYYPQNSMKADFCVKGRRALYGWCDDHGVAYRRCGKWVVAMDDGEADALAALFARGRANGVEGLAMAGATDLAELSTHIPLKAAFHSAETGIIDSHGLMLSFLGELEDHGGTLALKSRVVDIDVTKEGYRLAIVNDGMPYQLTCTSFINAAGLYAPDLCQKMTFLPPAFRPEAYYCRGQYFTYQGKTPFDRLIYPMPNTAGLGVHLTLDLAGQARFGPDVTWIDDVDYSFDAGRKDAFLSAIRRYWPTVDPDRLQPGYAGIRPKLVGPGEAAADFRIDGPADHGMRGLVNLLGIESPGLTASLAIADHVSNLDGL